MWFACFRDNHRSRPFSVSLAEPNGAGKAPLEKTKSGRALADGEFEVIFKQSELGFDVELVDDGGEPYVLPWLAMRNR